MDAIVIENLHKAFRGGRDEVLKGINVRFPEGKLSYILGPSGTGKSVTLKHVLGLLQPDQGKIEVFGTDLSTLSPSEWVKFRQQFGMVFQNSALFDDLTVMENVAFPLIEHTDLNDSEIEKEVSKILGRLGMKGPYDKFPSEISGGMRKRVGIARAIIKKPKILLYDEPTTGLDPFTRHTVDDLIETVKNDFNLTSIVISHDIPSALRLADHIVFLDQGKVVFQGERDHFLQSSHAAIRSFIDADLVSFDILQKARGARQ